MNLYKKTEKANKNKVEMYKSVQKQDNSANILYAIIGIIIVHYHQKKRNFSKKMWDLL